MSEEYGIKLVEHKSSDMPQIQQVLELYITQEGFEDNHMGRILITKTMPSPNKTWYTGHVYVKDQARSLEFYLVTIKKKVKQVILKIEPRVEFVNIYTVKQVEKML